MIPHNIEVWLLPGVRYDKVESLIVRNPTGALRDCLWELEGYTSQYSAARERFRLPPWREPLDYWGDTAIPSPVLYLRKVHTLQGRVLVLPESGAGDVVVVLPLAEVEFSAHRCREGSLPRWATQSHREGLSLSVGQRHDREDYWAWEADPLLGWAINVRP